MATKVTNGHSSVLSHGNGFMPSRSTITVKINGKHYEVDPLQIPASTSLNSFLRNNANLPGTKFMCLEGGCGACIVTATRRDPVTNKANSYAINSCLTPIYACKGLEITTIEGIGNRKDGYHRIQKRLTKFHGTQCGYCSPGMVMNMHGLLEANEGKVTMKQVENSFGGNICRCTGYRPILDAFKSMAIDADPKYKDMCADIEDITKMCPKTGDPCNGNCSSRYERSNHLCFADETEWYWPSDLVELYGIWAKIGSKPYTLVAGNTAHGVYRTPDDRMVFIAVNQIGDLHSYIVSPKEVIIGGNVCLTKTMEILLEASKLEGFEYFTEIVKHIDLIANVPVRNAGTIAGNLSLKHSHNEFPSDLFILMNAIKAKLTIGSKNDGKRVISLEDYLRLDMTKKIILSVTFQTLPAKDILFRSYKIMPRAQNAHAYVNTAFLVQFQQNVIKSCRLCFGGINPTFNRARKTEEFLIGKDLHTESIIKHTIQILQTEILCDWMLPDALPEYRRNLAISLFYKFILATCPPGKLSSTIRSGGDQLQRPLSSGIQNFDTNKDRWPITQPIEKIEGIIQAAGEAQYVNDIPNFPGQLWAAFVLATEVHAKILSIDPAEALKVRGVHHFFAANDIPGSNNFTPLNMMMINEVEEIFCSGEVKYHGQPVGIILADSLELANKVAPLVKIEYQKSGKEVLPTIFDVYRKNAEDRFKTIPVGIEPTVEGKETDIPIKGRFEIGGQYHFTMEAQSTVCVPTEDCLDVYSASQWVDITQVAVAQCLGVSESSINMQVRRLGGGYGSKLTRSSLIACACAVGAKLSNRPVRFVMTIESNMAAIGKRNGLISDYTVNVDRNGKICKMINDFAQDYGCSYNEDVVLGTTELVRNCYNFDTWKVTVKAVKTDSASNSWCRAPGTTEGIAMIENIMEHIAWVTDQDPVDVRMTNIPDDSKMKTLLPEFLESVDYRNRRDSIEQFNKENRWKKRGIAVVPMQYPQAFFGSIPVIVSIFHTDGTVAITHGGVECGQGINTKVVQVAAKTLDIPMEYIKIKPSLNSVTPNSICTGGSMTSEAVCYGTMKACETLLERMKPVREEMKSAKWPEITEACHQKLIDLSAKHLYKHTDVQKYITWGLSCAEIEVDILTGNFQLTRVDILEDTGESMSPHIDVGQVEGAFIMGLGYWLMENLIYDSAGKLLTNRTWNYKPPGTKDIPIDFRITFLRNSSNPLSVLRSKATGEPSMCMSVVCLFALRHAIEAARKDAGLSETWLSLGAPTTVEHVFLAAGTKPEQFRL